MTPVDPRRRGLLGVGAGLALAGLPMAAAAQQPPRPSDRAMLSAAAFAIEFACRVVTTTLIASSTRSRAYLSAVGRSASGNVCVWIFVASKRFSAISAMARRVALRPSPRMP